MQLYTAHEMQAETLFFFLPALWNIDVRVSTTAAILD